ncbi:hypothetical protein [Dickeya chrysanthemi]|uniref:hypothetical protein n=1 Tax=Dickeya chrysanthemi TaxID=556 RepID=UPI0003A11ED1|nr:hypothetical protein [Dickeya chrysanthemi]
MIKLIITDLDGTFLRSHGEIDRFRDQTDCFVRKMKKAVCRQPLSDDIELTG